VKKILCVFAHREDHIIAGWPIMQMKNVEKHLFICTDDHKDAVEESAKSCASSVTRHFFLNGFSYRKGITRTEYLGLEEKIHKVADKINVDYIFTHNPWGEYGHFDHRILFSIIFNSFPGSKVLFTDIVATSLYYPEMFGIPSEYLDLVKCKSAFVNAKMDKEFYKKQAAIFINKNAWTKNAALNLPVCQDTAVVYCSGFEEL
jgi:hypothetical protein